MDYFKNQKVWAALDIKAFGLNIKDNWSQTVRITFPPPLEESGGFFIPANTLSRCQLFPRPLMVCFDMRIISAIFQGEVITAGFGKLSAVSYLMHPSPVDLTVN
jgi:hypothetical protein